MKKLTYVAGLAALGLALQANAALVLDPTVTAGFLPGSSGIDPGNDLPNSPPAIRFGQLSVTQDGVVEFFYTGNEAAYTNTMRIDGSTYTATPNFVPPDTAIGSLNVTAGSFVDFGFCTSGGASVGAFGMCASNNNAASLIAQFNFMAAPGDEPGYRSIGYRALSTYNPTAGLSNAALSTYAPTSTTDSSLWAIFWDDSGKQNDDDYDDFIAVARFTPVTPNQTSVSEPLTLALLGSGLFGIGAMRRRVKG
jgi:hypothetical protein